MAQSHYEVLGVSRDAPAARLRAAYLDRAREVHPDRVIDSSPQARREAERRMQEVTEAWRVLGDPGRRRRYDHDLDASDPRARARRIDLERFATRDDGTMPEDLEALDPTARLVRSLPWVAVILVLAVIFIFTAYAFTGGTKSKDAVVTVGDCVTIDAASNVRKASCNAAGAHPVKAVVEPTRQCPDGTQPFVPLTGATKLCLEG
jgi:curved DNA-binding protein CbpA